MKQYQQSSKTKLIAAVVILVVIAGTVLLANHLKTTSKTTSAVAPASSNTPASANTTDSTSGDTTTASTSNSATGKSYSASSTYQVPHGSESITVNLTVDNGTVTGAAIQNSEYDHDSARYQEDFAAVYKQYVIGKKVAGLQLGALAGASDTAQGFNDAVSRIASQID